jgi:mRNA-degrading endonuclease toxin of MazEF toxin-antitoxin module
VVKGSLVWVSLDPARGAEVPKTRPCVVVSRTEANDISSTVTVVPLSSVRGRAAERLVQRCCPPKIPVCLRTHVLFATK